MAYTSPHGSAKIYQFPVRVRAAGDREAVNTGANLRSPRISPVAVASGWYHEAAIQDSNLDRER